MSNCLYARISKKCLTEELLEQQIINHCMCNNEIVINKKEGCVTYGKIVQDDQIVITFIEEKKPPYNIYDFNISNEEFEYMQLVIFDIKKEFSSNKIYAEIIDFCIGLKKKINGDLLITSDVHDEICLIKDEKIIWYKELV